MFFRLKFFKKGGSQIIEGRTLYGTTLTKLYFHCFLPLFQDIYLTAIITPFLLILHTNRMIRF